MTTKTLPHPLITGSAEETLYRVATVIACMANCDSGDASDEATFGRELIMSMCVATLLYESTRAALTEFKARNGAGVETCK